MFKRIHARSKESKERISILYFLNKNAFLVPVLFKVEDKINFFFKDELADITLEKFLNPETGEEKIILTIILDTTPEKALERFKEFRNNWWLNVVKNTNWKLEIDIDFVSSKKRKYVRKNEP